VRYTKLAISARLRFLIKTRYINSLLLLYRQLFSARKYIVSYMSVCMHVCLSILHEILFTCDLRPWLGLTLTTLQCVMYFRFCGWRHVGRFRQMAASVGGGAEHTGMKCAVLIALFTLQWVVSLILRFPFMHFQ